MLREKDSQAKRIVSELQEDPYRVPPPFEKLKADLKILIKTIQPQKTMSSPLLPTKIY